MAGMLRSPHEVVVSPLFLTKSELALFMKWCDQNIQTGEWCPILGGFAFASHDHAVLFMMTWS